jgi:hypothetical protein
MGRDRAAVQLQVELSRCSHGARARFRKAGSLIGFRLRRHLRQLYALIPSKSLHIERLELLLLAMEALPEVQQHHLATTFPEVEERRPVIASDYGTTHKGMVLRQCPFSCQLTLQNRDRMCYSCWQRAYAGRNRRCSGLGFGHGQPYENPERHLLLAQEPGQRAEMGDRPEPAGDHNGVYQASAGR